MNLMHGAFAVGAIIGPMAVGALIHAGLGWTIVFRGMAAIFVVLAIIMIFTPLELAALARMQWYATKDNGYSTQQATRPQTLGYALADSPVGQMCWIVEKFHGWTDCGHGEGGQSIGGDPERAVSRDAMLDDVSLYWLTNSGASSARLYWESFRGFATGQVALPMGASLFPLELFRLSRRWAAQRYTNIVYWNETARGGHFAALKQPELFAAEVKACFGAMSL